MLPNIRLSPASLALNLVSTAWTRPVEATSARHSAEANIAWQRRQQHFAVGAGRMILVRLRVTLRAFHALLQVVQGSTIALVFSTTFAGIGPQPAVARSGAQVASGIRHKTSRNLLQRRFTQSLPLAAWWLLQLQMAGGIAATAKFDIRWRRSSMPDHAEFVRPGLPFYNLDVAAARDGATPAGFAALPPATLHSLVVRARRAG
ncbi:MAG: hypothetical protein H6978_07065 [Gammaproteobacteria bacterium]|nr:hypothetical protein [Gammaproteobacteria bacterium]